MHAPRTAKTMVGRPTPLGATFEGDGVNFALYSANADAVDVCLFDASGRHELARHRLDRRTGDVWHGFIPDLKPGQLYGYRVHGPYDPHTGHRFNANKLLIDPYARALSGRIINDDANFGYTRGHPDGDLSFDERDNAAFMPRCVVVGPEDVRTTGTPPLTPWSRSILYELHVAGMTRAHPDVPEPLRGSFAGLASDAVVGHLEALGVTAIELLPIFPYADEPHLVEKGLTNYWGYNPYTFFAPEPRYAHGAARDEFRAMVGRFHDAGIEVILDVVYNHTGEGWHLGPTLSLRGIDNASYYRLWTEAPRLYVDDTGCGNTLALDRPPVFQMVVDSLTHWVEEMGVDGFRFDLATTLARTDAGFNPNAPLLKVLASDPVLSRIKLIAEPWDVGPGGYQLGQFKGAFSEWNDRYRSAVRSFWRGDGGRLGELATRVTGSSDIMRGHQLGPQASLNYVTAHDGFTLSDLVSYSAKHNEANGENNRDGSNDNLSANHGIEGPTDEPDVNATRALQMRNMLATLLLSQGVPMLLAGDEIGHSQQGNNNAYCQDNALAWIDWSRSAKAPAQAQLSFVQALTALRQSLPGLRQTAFLAGRPRPGEHLKDASWWSPDGQPMSAADWSLDFARVVGLHLACARREDEPPAPHVSVREDVAPDRPARNASPDDADAAPETGAHLLILFNAHDGEVTFRLPPDSCGARWHVLLDTAQREGEAAADSFAAESPFPLSARSLVLMSSAQDTAAVASPEPGAQNVKPARSARPAEPATLDHLCRSAGIALSFWDLKGRENRTTPDTQRALLAAMSLDASNEASARDALRRLDHRPWQRLVAPATVMRRQQAANSAPTQHPQQVVLNIPSVVMGHRLAWRIRLEDGGEIRGDADPRALHVLASRRVDGTDIIRLALQLPPALPDGIHALHIEIASLAEAGTLILAPAHCYLPDWLERGERQWGLACQLYGLRAGEAGNVRSGIADSSARDTGIGDLSSLADLARHVGRAGGAAMGINPLHALFLSEPQRASPYSPSSRLHLNPLYIDPTAVPEFAESDEARAALSTMGSHSGDLVDYARIAKPRLAVLDALHAAFERAHPVGSVHPRRQSYDAFLADGGSALQRFATFQALEESLGPPHTWGSAYADPDGAEVRAFAGQHEHRRDFFAFLQFEADRQLGAASRAARDSGMGIGLYGDLAVGAAPDGAEVWSAPEAFAGGCRFGAPPDPFSETGQDWGMPPMNPHDFAATGYRGFAQLLHANMRHAGALRLDHVMWLERMFWIPAGGSARDGTYVRYPREDLLGVLALMSHRHRCLIVGEDLGTVPDGFRELMAREGVLSYRFVRFERFHDGLFRRPDTYPHLALATPASHDLATLAGFWQGRDVEAMLSCGVITPEDAAAMLETRARERVQLVAALADQALLPADFTVDADLDDVQRASLVDAVHSFLARTPSALVMANIEDLAGVADQANLPGTIDAYPNWRRRLPLAVDAPALLTRLRETADLMARERGAAHGQAP